MRKVVKGLFAENQVRNVPQITVVAPLGIRVQPDLQAVGFVKRNALIYSIPATPPKRPHINYNIHYSSKDNTSPEIYRNKFLSFVTITKIFLNCTLMALRWGTKWQQR